jgi:hypothetical protein
VDLAVSVSTTVERRWSASYPCLVTMMTDREIIARYPQLFDLSGDVTVSAMHLGFQFAGSGWLGVMATLCERLVPLVGDSGFRILSVKSKFGTLRVTYRGGSDAVEAEIEAAKAEATWEFCGQVGERRG